MVSSPVYASLLVRQKIAGVDRNVFLVFLLVSFSMILSMGQYWFIFVSAIGYIGLKWVSKYDEFGIPIFMNLFYIPSYVLE